MRTQDKFLLAYFKGCREGMTHSQIAAKLKMSYNAYYQRVLYHKKKWSAKLKIQRIRWPEPDGRVQSIDHIKNLLEEAGY